ncbi:MAG: GAF domain-containing protein [Bacteroidetes bacterium]|jgi:L-methionine (R)-S-oxide reductase|nr:GAF domain-containing protein [Bacteroidota bacterium]
MDKKESYRHLLTAARGLLKDEQDRIANLANLTALIKEQLGFFWVGFYEVKKNELVLGPFQGPVACTRIAKGKGVCGTSWAESRPITVKDVHEFPGHIACSPLSQSEIVVPIFVDGQVRYVLDIDSDRLATFDATDEEGLMALCEMITEAHPTWD